MTTPLNPPAAKSIDAHLADARKLAATLLSGNPDRDSISDIADNIAQAVEAVTLMDRGMRLTSKRRIDDINFVLDSMEAAARRLVMLAETVEDEENGDDEMPLNGAF